MILKGTQLSFNTAQKPKPRPRYDHHGSLMPEPRDQDDDRAVQPPVPCAAVSYCSYIDEKKPDNQNDDASKRGLGGTRAYDIRGYQQ
jgi:hypothetical protein